MSFRLPTRRLAMSEPAALWAAVCVALTLCNACQPTGESPASEGSAGANDRDVDAGSDAHDTSLIGEDLDAAPPGDAEAGAPSDADVAPASPATLRILLRWDEENTDLDLHLVRNFEGLADAKELEDLFGDRSNDCFYFTCKPSPASARGTSALDWGAPGDDSDNPVLDEDDSNGGPETIRLARPADGRYSVLVHYNDSDQSPSTVPELEVWWGERLEKWVIARALRPQDVLKGVEIDVVEGLPTLYEIDRILGRRPASD